MQSIAISLLTICGIEELPEHRARKVTHVLSILDPQEPELIAFDEFDAHERTTLRFHDIIDPLPGQIPPEPHHVEEILEFGKNLAATVTSRTEGHLLVHCHAGVSRSTAAMLALMAQVQPEETADDLFARLRDIRPRAWPNSRMVQFADDLLGRNGAFMPALARHYAHQLQVQPQYEQWMSQLGRGREVAMGKAA